MIMDAFHSIKPVFGRSKRVSTQGSGLFSTSDVTRSDADSWWLATDTARRNEASEQLFERNRDAPCCKQAQYLPILGSQYRYSSIIVHCYSIMNISYHSISSVYSIMYSDVYWGG